MASDATYEDLGAGNVYRGRKAIIACLNDVHQASNDYRIAMMSAQRSEDWFALEYEMSGTHTGEAEGILATNKSYRFRGVFVGQLDATGKITNSRDYFNMADFLTQIGLLPKHG
jgi:steroid delta-isomerase-like uncharacterized protein